MKWGRCASWYFHVEVPAFAGTTVGVAAPILSFPVFRQAQRERGGDLLLALALSCRGSRFGGNDGGVAVPILSFDKLRMSGEGVLLLGLDLILSRFPPSRERRLVWMPHPVLPPSRGKGFLVGWPGPVEGGVVAVFAGVVPGHAVVGVGAGGSLGQGEGGADRVAGVFEAHGLLAAAND